jgi:hypothetical protein
MGLFGTTNIGLFDGGDAPVEQVFTSNGTWSCCPGALRICVIAVGAGGGGDSGGVSNIAACRANAGGPGGGGGGFVAAALSSAQIPTSACVIIGAAGSGAIANTSAGNGYKGTDGGDTCFGSCLIARGGKAGDTGGVSPRLGGSANVTLNGGINGCAGAGGTATIVTGTGVAIQGNCGGDQIATCWTPQSALSGRDGEAAFLSPRGGGGGGAIGRDNVGNYCCGLGGAAYASFTCCGLSIGGGGAGGNAPDTAGSNATGYGGGGGSSAGSLTCSAAAGSGGAGVIKVIQYFR